MSKPTEKPIRELCAEARATAASKGWDSFMIGDWDNPVRKDVLPRCLFLLVAEIAEAGEAYRRGKMRGDHGFVDEMADAFIRIMDIMGAFPDDFHAAIRQKMDFNTTRPAMHGGKKV